MSAERETVPVPCLIKLPEPLMMPLMALLVSERFKTKLALLVMAVATKEPVVEPLPICKLPAEMVVVPV